MNIHKNAKLTARSREEMVKHMMRAPASHLRSLGTKEPARRYQWEPSGQTFHLSIKRFGKVGGVGHRKIGRCKARRKWLGWEYPHARVDDASRAS